jgi:tetratricopeptide (TPR) repeat protein
VTGRWIVRPLAVLGLAVVLLLGAAVAVTRSSEPTRADQGRPVSLEAAGTAAGADLGSTIAGLQERVRRLPQDWQAMASLGVAYVQQAASTADPSYYAKAEAVLNDSLAEHPDGNDLALTGQAALEAARHDFPAARELADRALALNPFSASAYGVLTDALVEIGDYEAAFASLQKMLDLRPAVPSYTRASYAFELRGNADAAREALEQALRIAVDPADAAFAHRYLGELAFGDGDLDKAEQQSADGLRRAPSYTPLLVGTARVLAARGEHEAAIETYTKAVQRLPEPGTLTELGELYESLGRTDEAQEQYDVVRATQRLQEAAGVDLDLEQTLFLADHGDPAAALSAASAAWQTRRSVQSADAYAWALHVNGRHQEALELAEQAQRLGTRSALFDYHRGMIQRALGDDGAARRSLTAALRTNPHFSPLHARTAQAALGELGGPA